jgi:hypothetical protein
MLAILRVAVAVLILIILGIGTAVAAPDNDDFTNRTVLTGTNISFQAYLLDAGIEAGEPNHLVEPDRSSQSIWWSWTAPEDGLVEISEEPGNFRAAVYTGATLESLTVVARWELNSESVPPFPVRRGESYQIAVVNRGGVETYPARVDVLRLRFYPPPRNDNFSDRIRIGGEREVLTANFSMASREPGEPVHVWESYDASLWWEWTPPVSGVATWSWPIAVYRGSSLENMVPALLPRFFPKMEVRAGEPLQLAVFGHAGSLELLDAILSVSRMRIVSPVSGTRVAFGSSLTLKLENVPSDITNIVVESEHGRWSFPPNSSEVVIDWISPGVHSFFVTGQAREGYQYNSYSPEITIIAGAGSDSFGGAYSISDHYTVIGGDFAEATEEAGEPPSGSPGQQQSGTVWWRWTAPSRGRVMTAPWSFAAGAVEATSEFFTGSSLSDLRRVRLDEESGLPTSDWPGPIFYAEPGLTYWIRLRLVGHPPFGWAGTGFTFQPQATNDAFAHRTQLTGTSAQIPLTSDFTTFETDEPAPTPPDTGSEWFTYTPPANGTLNLRVQSPHLPGIRGSLMAFTGGSLTSLSSVAGPATQTQFSVRRGDVYQIRVVSSNDMPVYTLLHLRLDVIPDNDNLTDAVELTGEAGSLSASNGGATTEPGENTGRGAQSVWYRFTASQDGALLVSTRPSDENAESLAFRPWFATGDTIANLDWGVVQARDDRGTAVVELLRGQVVQLAVYGGSSDPARSSTFVLDHQFVPRPPNDLFQNRQGLAGTRIETRGTNWIAASEPDEPGAGTNSPQRTVWWTWTAPGSGILDVRTPRTPLALFTGDSLASLQRVRPADTISNALGGLRFPVVAGTNYQIVADRGDDQGWLTAFTTNGFNGFPLSMRLGSIELASPRDLSILTAGQPVELALKPVNAALDGTISSVTYLLFTNISRSVRSVSLGTVTQAPFALTLTNFPSGLHQVQAVVTNQAREVLSSPVVAVRIVPANDDFANALELAGFRFTNTVTWSGATYEPGEPAGATAVNGTIWYRWRAPASGPLRVTSPVPGLLLYQGDRLTNLVAVSRGVVGNEAHYNEVGGADYYVRIVTPASDSAPGAVRSGSFSFDLVAARLFSPVTDARYAAGQDVPFRLEPVDPSVEFASVGFDVGGVRLATLSAPPWTFVWTNPPSGQHTVIPRIIVAGGASYEIPARPFVVGPVNDEFEAATPIEGRSGTLRATTLGSTSVASGLGDVWFSWTAPADGLLFMSSAGVWGSGPWTALYTGTNATDLELQPLYPSGPWGYQCWLVRSNAVYRVRAATAFSTGFRDFDLRWDLKTRVQNDNFADRLPLSGTEGEERASFILGTIETGEPYYDIGNAAVASVWWTWVPPRDGILEINSPAFVRAYTGSTSSTLARAPQYGGDSWPPPGPNHFRVTAGVPLQLSFVLNSDVAYDVQWNWRLLDSPMNDDFADRVVLQGTRTTVTGSALHAPDEPWERELFGGANTVWWTWTAPYDGDLTLRLWGVEKPHSVAICRGEHPDSLEVIQRFSEGTGFIIDRRPLAVKAGDRLQIRVAGPWPGEEFELNLDLRHRPLNDDFANRERLEGIQAVVSGANWMSGRETGEPDHSGRSGGRSVWYSWRAPTNGVAVVEFGPPTLALAAYEGDSLATLREAGTMTLDGAPLRFPVQAGHDYAIAVDGISGFTGDFGVGIQLFDVLPIPFMSIRLDHGDVYQIDILDLTPGFWVLEKSGDLKTWAFVSNVSMYGPLPIYVTVNDGSMDFFRVRRLD